MNAEPIFRGAGRNPFYLLSALFMLLGCFALSHHLTLEPGHWKALLLLIGVLQVYELILLAIAVYLERRSNARFDATTLFFLGLLFVVDATHLNGELAVSSPAMAPWIATWLLLLAAGKLAVLQSAVGLASRRAFAVAIAQIAVVLYLPGVASRVQVLGLGNLTLPRLLYGLWWLVGCLPLVDLWAGRQLDASSPRSATRIGRATLALPLASLFVHVLSLHWLYELPLQASYVTPLLLGAATFGAIVGGPMLGQLRFHLRWSAPLLAVAFSLDAPALWVATPDRIAFVLSPLRLALLGASLVWLLHYAREGLNPFAWSAGGSFMAAISGHSLTAIAHNWGRFAPTTGFELGVASIVAAFALLALGFARSLVPTEPRRNRWRPNAFDSNRPC